MTTFTFGGTNLSTFGKITEINDYLDLPERRGSNLEIPYKHGTLYVPKYYSERVVPFGIALTESSLANLEAKLNTMRALFAIQTQQTLSITYEDGTTKTSPATVDKPLQVARTATMARVVVEFTLTSPFFRSSVLYEVTSDAIDGTPTPQTLTVVNSGTAEERSPTFVLTGALKNPVITNTTNGVSLTYTGTIASGATVTIGELNGEFYATHSASGDVIGNVTHSGSSALMVLNTGNNAVTISDADYAGGNVKFAYYPPYL